MQAVTREQVVEILHGLGLHSGDNLLVHAAIQFLGRPVGGPGMYLDAVQQVIGAGGTLAVPAFNFGFCRGEPFDPANTPSDGMGVFAEHVRRQPAACRTPHPMQSLAVIGPLAAELCGRDTPAAFDPGSAFERLWELDFKLLLLGATVSAVSLLHLSEQRAQVPYRHWKDFSGLYRRADGWQLRTYRMYVRDAEMRPVLTLDHVYRFLEEQGQWTSLPLNYGRVSLCPAADFVAAVDMFIQRDPWALVVNRDEVIKVYQSVERKHPETAGPGGASS